MQRRALLAWLGVTTLLVGCGASSADVPDELLDAIARQGGASSYPAGPYGTGVGDVVQDLCWDGWEDPSAAGYDPARFGRVCLSEFHADPDARLLLVNSSAIWCVACRSEYGGSSGADGRPSLAQHLAAYRDDGFRVLGTLFEDAASRPATPEDAAFWARTYQVAFPFVLDDEHQLGLFTSSSIAPFNMLIDTRTMKIVLELAGDEPAVTFGKVEEFLSSKGPATE